MLANYLIAHYPVCFPLFMKAFPLLVAITFLPLLTSCQSSSDVKVNTDLHDNYSPGYYGPTYGNPYYEPYAPPVVIKSDSCTIDHDTNYHQNNEPHYNNNDAYSGHGGHR